MKLETTAEEREVWSTFSGGPEYNWPTIRALVRDLDRALAEIARLTEHNRILGESVDAIAAQAEKAEAEVDRLTAALAEARKLGNLSNALWRAAEDDNAELRKPIEHDDMLCFTRGAFARMVEEKTDMEKQIASIPAREAAAREEEREALQRDIQAMREQYSPLEEGEAVMLDTLEDRVQRRAAIRARTTP